MTNWVSWIHKDYNFASSEFEISLRTVLWYFIQFKFISGIKTYFSVTHVVDHKKVEFQWQRVRLFDQQVGGLFDTYFDLWIT
jgi:hypothetical protein